MKMFIHPEINVNFVKKNLLRPPYCNDMKESIQVKSHLNAIIMDATQHLHKNQHWMNIIEFIQERNRFNVMYVIDGFALALLWLNIWELFTVSTNHMFVIFATKHFIY